MVKVHTSEEGKNVASRRRVEMAHSPRYRRNNTSTNTDTDILGLQQYLEAMTDLTRQRT